MTPDDQLAALYAEFARLTDSERELQRRLVLTAEDHELLRLHGEAIRGVCDAIIDLETARLLPEAEWDHLATTAKGPSV